MNKKVSIITPVYNAEKYITEAVTSALNQPETGEVILIEDGSNDKSLTICKNLEKQYSLVKLYTHPENQNKGAGASRNLGIVKSKFNIIAFLDADDYYCNNRFSIDIDLLQKSDIDGVYGGTGFYFEHKHTQEDWIKKRGTNDQLTTIKNDLQAVDLFRYLLFPSHGIFTTNAITFKRTLLAKTGLFDIHLRLHQDTVLWLKMAAVGKLVPGQTKKAIAIRRVHPENRISKIKPDDFSTNRLLYQTLLKWAIDKQLDPLKIDLIKYRIWKNESLIYPFHQFINNRNIEESGQSKFSIRIIFLTKHFATHPNLFFHKYFFRTLFTLNSL